MTKEEWLKQIYCCLDASISCVEVISQEEMRVMEYLKFGASEWEDVNIYVWNSAEGISTLSKHVKLEKNFYANTLSDLIETCKDKNEDYLLYIQDLEPIIKQSQVVNHTLLRKLLYWLRDVEHNEYRQMVLYSHWGADSFGELANYAMKLQFPSIDKEEILSLFSKDARVYFEERKEFIRYAKSLPWEVLKKEIQLLQYYWNENNVEKWRFTKRLNGYMMENKKRLLNECACLISQKTDTSFAHIGGKQKFKRWMIDRYHRDKRVCVLLTGVPGCGKSMCAKAVAGELKLPLIRWDMSNMLQGVLGKSEADTVHTLKILEVLAPAVIWIDEIDKILMMNNGLSDGGTVNRILAQVLVWLQENKAPLVLVATANHASKLQMELLRKGRFDEIFFFDLPKESERREIISITAKSFGLPEDSIWIDMVAKKTQDYSGAELEELVKRLLEHNISSTEALQQVSDMKDIVKPMSMGNQELINSLRQWAKRVAIF